MIESYQIKRNDNGVNMIKDINDDFTDYSSDNEKSDMKKALVLSGITELEEHGIGNFSLRRAAIGAQVSCAAPYRHFKSKEEYINEIILYVGSKWELLSKEIYAIFSDNPAALVREICIANLRFRIANRNFPLALAHTRGSGKSIDESIEAVVSDYCKSKGLDKENEELKGFTALTLIYGAVSMITDENSEKVLELVARKLKDEFK